MQTKPGKIDVGKVFGDLAKRALDLLAQAAVEQVADTKPVQQAIEKQKVVAGKNVLWTYFPYILLGTVGLFMLARIK